MALKTSTGVVVTDPGEKAELFNNFFSNVFTSVFVPVLHGSEVKV